MKTLPKNGILLIIFLTPLFGAVSSFGYEQIKVLFFLLSITLIGFLWLLVKPEFKWTGIAKVGGIFIFILAITSLLGIQPQNSILGVAPYFQGWILYAYLYLFYLMVKEFGIEIKKYALVLSASALLVSLVAIKDWVLLNIFNQQIPNYAGRVVSTFGQPNFFAGFLLMSLPFAYFLFNQDGKLRYLGLASGLISIVGIFVSYSRSAILLALMLLALGLMDQLKIKKFAIAVFAVATMAIFLSVSFSSGFIWKEFLQLAMTSNPDLTRQSVENRIYIWPQALRLVWEKPFTGYGLENIEPAFTNYFEKNKHSLFEENLKVSPVLLSLKELNLDRTHNYILDLLMFSGVLGLVGGICLLAALFRKLLQTSVDRKQNVLFVSLITYLVWIQFQNQSVVQLMYFWLLAGLIDQGKGY